MNEKELSQQEVEIINAILNLKEIKQKGELSIEEFDVLKEELIKKILAYARGEEVQF